MLSNQTYMVANNLTYNKGSIHYFLQLIAMMELFICKMALQNKRKCNFIKEAADYFLQDVSLLDEDIRHQLKIGPTGPYTQVRCSYS